MASPIKVGVYRRCNFVCVYFMWQTHGHFMWNDICAVFLGKSVVVNFFSFVGFVRVKYDGEIFWEFRF